MNEEEIAANFAKDVINELINSKEFSKYSFENKVAIGTAFIALGRELIIRATDEEKDKINKP